MRKLDYLLDLAKLKPSDHVLEVGFGWGSMAIRAVQASLSFPDHFVFFRSEPAPLSKAFQQAALVIEESSFGGRTAAPWDL